MDGILHAPPARPIRAAGEPPTLPGAEPAHDGRLEGDASASCAIRAATAADEAAIVALVRSERLNPTALQWPRFVVAERGGRLAGALQLRRHRDDARELGSPVVAADERGRGIAARLIDRLLQGETAAVHLITAEAHAPRCRAWASGRSPRGTRRAPCAGTGASAGWPASSRG